MGIGIGSVLALCVILLLYLVRNNPAKAKKILAPIHTHTCARTHTHIPTSRTQHDQHDPDITHACTHTHTHKSKSKLLKVSFLSVEVLLALKTFFAGLDFYTDTHVLFFEVLRADSSITHDILVPWIIFHAISSVVRRC